MTLDNFIKKVQKMAYPQALDKTYEGACPCFWVKVTIDEEPVNIHGHCWRVCKYCSFNGIHVTSKLPMSKLKKLAKAFKKQLDAQNWYSKYEIQYYKEEEAPYND